MEAEFFFSAAALPAMNVPPFFDNTSVLMLSCVPCPPLSRASAGQLPGGHRSCRRRVPEVQDDQEAPGPAHEAVIVMVRCRPPCARQTAAPHVTVLVVWAGAMARMNKNNNAGPADEESVGLFSTTVSVAVAVAVTSDVATSTRPLTRVLRSRGKKTNPRLSSISRDTSRRDWERRCGCGVPVPAPVAGAGIVAGAVAVAATAVVVAMIHTTITG